MIQTTVLHPKHLEAGAKMVDFHGWEMPINYGSQLEEHHAVRSDAGMFDVSHMTIVDLTGERVKAFLQHLLANDVAKLTAPGKALYSGMLNPIILAIRSTGWWSTPLPARRIWPGSAITPSISISQ